MIKAGKRGQFYLIAAFVIIGLVVGAVAITNYSKKPSSVKVYNLKEELGIESEQVISYGTFSNGNLQDILDDFIKNYSEYASGDTSNLYFVYGNPRDGIKIASYQSIETGSIGISVGGTPTTIPTETKALTQRDIFAGPGENVEIQLEEGSAPIKFKIKQGENFYFIITQESGGNRFVETG